MGLPRFSSFHPKQWKGMLQDTVHHIFVDRQHNEKETSVNVNYEEIWNPNRGYYATTFSAM
jgi:hypothetical protein